MELRVYVSSEVHKKHGANDFAVQVPASLLAPNEQSVAKVGRRGRRSRLQWPWLAATPIHRCPSLAAAQLAELVRKKATAKLPADTPLLIFPEFEPLSAGNVQELLPTARGPLGQHALVLGSGASARAQPPAPARAPPGWSDATARAPGLRARSPLPCARRPALQGPPRRR
jgi:hypothetical protein